jgi:hypothetical protein
MRHAKIRQRVVVHRHPAAQPTIRQMLLAQPGQLPRAPTRQLSPTATAPSSARAPQVPDPAPPRAPSPHRAMRANRALGQTPRPPAPDDRAPPDRRLPQSASPADAAPAAATAASPDSALPVLAAPATLQTTRYCPTSTGSPSHQSSAATHTTTKTCCNPASGQICAKGSHALRCTVAQP